MRSEKTNITNPALKTHFIMISKSGAPVNRLLFVAIAVPAHPPPFAKSRPLVIKRGRVG